MNLVNLLNFSRSVQVPGRHRRAALPEHWEFFLSAVPAVVGLESIAGTDHFPQFTQENKLLLDTMEAADSA